MEYQEHKAEALQLLEDEEITQEDYEQLLSEGDFTCDTPLIRYDLSLKQYCECYHPAAHLHVGFYVENRWPVCRKLTPFAFFLKILMHYYPKLWIDAGDLGIGKGPNKLDDLYRDEVSRCESLDSDYFTELEAQRLHIS